MVSGEETPGDDEALVLEGEDSPIEIAQNVVNQAATTKKKGRGKKQEELGPSGLPYTPLEKQFMEIKDANPDVLLLTEVGYKFKFHGDDAKIASKELGIAW